MVDVLCWLLLGKSAFNSRLLVNTACLYNYTFYFEVHFSFYPVIAGRLDWELNLTSANAIVLIPICKTVGA